MTETVQTNKLVSITYRILDENDELLEQSDLPMDYIQGTDDRMLPKIMASLEGKRVGDEIRVTLAPEEGFGFPDPNLIITDDIDNAPLEFRVVGARPTFQNENGETMEMVVTQVGDGTITVDGNHPFAGKTVTFLIRVVAVRDAGEFGAENDLLTAPGPTTLQ